MDKKEYIVNEALEAMLRASAEDIEDEIADALLGGFGGQEHVFSEKHEKDMNQLFEKERKIHSSNKTKIYLRRAAAIFIAVISISIATISSVNALRIRFLNFISEITQQDTTIHFADENTELPLYKFENMTFEYIPKGFYLIESSKAGNSLSLEFKNNNEYFDFYLKSLKSALSIDTENSLVKELEINGKKALYSEKNNSRILVWYDDSNAYVLTGNISENELIKIAENIKIKIL